MINLCHQRKYEVMSMISWMEGRYNVDKKEEWSKNATLRTGRKWRTHSERMCSVLYPTGRF